jgi:hypothetical protein
MAKHSLYGGRSAVIASQPRCRSFGKNRIIAALMLCTSLGSLAACSSTEEPDSAQSAMGRKSKLPPGKSIDTSGSGTTTPTPLPVSSGPVVYDASVGTGVDGGGFALLPLRSGAHRFFVNSSAGSDGNGCSGGQSAATPLKSIAAAVGCVTDGAGDQVLLAEGMRYAEALPWVAFKGGFSAQYPTVIQSYDPADPANEAKYGRGDQRGARPVLTAPQQQVSNGTYQFIAIRGLDFNPGNVPNVNLMFVGNGSYVLIENNLFQYTGLSWDNYIAKGQHLVVRGNAFHGMWNSVNGRAGGVYAANIDGVTLEDNVFWHNGWKEGASRDDDFSVGGATVFSHSFYLQTNTWNGIVRRNLSVDGAGDGGIARGDILATENVSIDNPACLGLGGGPTYSTDRPAGIKIEASYNACFGDADVTSSHPLGWGISTIGGIAGSSVHHNLLARTRDPNGPSVQALANVAPQNVPSYMTFDSNRLYRWAASGHSYQHCCFGYDAQALTTFTNNIWDDPTDGTNLNNAGVAFPNPYTAAQLYAALGCTDKATCLARAIQTPELKWATKARLLLFAGYGM